MNPEDPEVSELRSRYAASEVHTDFAYRAGPARVADNGELKFSLATARKFIPFVRRTFILGSGAPPSWLAEFGDSVTYVSQKDIIPASFWPTFLSETVEAYIHLIPDLSEHYIYSNDDFFFARAQSPSDFFDDNGHTTVGIDSVVMATGAAPIYRATEENSIRALRRHVRLPSFTSNYPHFSKGLRIRRRVEDFARKARFRLRGLPVLNAISHISQPYLKSEWTGYHQTFRKEMMQLASRRFRSEQAFSTNTMYHYYLHDKGKASFYLAKDDRHLRRSASIEMRESFRRELVAPNSLVRRFCLNDTPVESEDFWSEYIQSLADALR